MAQFGERIQELERDWFGDAQVLMVTNRLENLADEARTLLTVLFQHAPIDRGRFLAESRTNEDTFNRNLDVIYRTGLIERYADGPAQFWRAREQYIEALRKVLFPPRA